MKSYNIGDTVIVNLVPLINEQFLAAAGVSMNVDLNDDGTFTINEGSTYPTTEAETVQHIQRSQVFQKLGHGQEEQVATI